MSACAYKGVIQVRGCLEPNFPTRVCDFTRLVREIFRLDILTKLYGKYIIDL